MALQLRLLLTSGTAFAVATVLGARGTALRRPGTVIVTSESGQTIGFNRPARSTRPSGTWPPRRWRPGKTSWNGWKSITRRPATSACPADQPGHPRHPGTSRRPMFGNALRYLDSGAATALAIGTCGVSGHAVIGADGVAGWFRRPELPARSSPTPGPCSAPAAKCTRPAAWTAKQAAPASRSGCSLTPAGDTRPGRIIRDNSSLSLIIRWLACGNAPGTLALATRGLPARE